MEDGEIVDVRNSIKKQNNKDLNVLSDDDIKIESSKRRSPHKPSTEQAKKQPLRGNDFNSDDERLKSGALSRNIGVKQSETEPIEKLQSRNFGGIVID